MFLCARLAVWITASLWKDRGTSLAAALCALTQSPHFIPRTMLQQSRTNLSWNFKLQALIEANPASHKIKKQRNVSPSLLLAPPIDHSTCVTPNPSSFCAPSFPSPIFKHFSRPHFIYIAASSPRLLIHCSPHISPFLSRSLSPRQWAHPGSLGPLECIISSKRYPSALTSALAGCLPSQLNGLINPSWFLDGLDFIVSYSPLSSCSSLFLNVILSDFNMSAFSEHPAFDYIELRRAARSSAAVLVLRSSLRRPETWAFACYICKCVVK